jgi:DNA-binding IclR family transcriptional regulator
VSYVSSEGELQPGASGVAAAVTGVPSVEASVGVVALTGLDPAGVGPRVVQAAAEVARRLR